MPSKTIHIFVWITLGLDYDRTNTHSLNSGVRPRTVASANESSLRQFHPRHGTSGDIQINIQGKTQVNIQGEIYESTITDLAIRDER
ncbi:MAG: hypothetical protein HC795_04885 [Coleofasciculaceae cyanobacterium RL_1_1]|nr:hypothetical protein [Coleofasciculaceae cyanobacterium RL_1_1]